MKAFRQSPDSALGGAPRSKAVPHLEGRAGNLVGSRRCHEDAPRTRPAVRTLAAVLSALLITALVVFVLFVIDRTADGPQAWAATAQGFRPEGPSPNLRWAAATSPKATPRDRREPLPLYSDDRPTGSQTKDIGLIATNIPLGHSENSMALLLDVEADRYVLLFLGDRWGDYEVISIATHWVQLRRGGADHWVGYVENRRSRNSAPQPTAQAPLPREVQRAPRAAGPTVTYKWLFGRINHMGELEKHLTPTRTDQGLQVGSITTGFRRIGMQVGDVVVQAGDRPVRTVDDIRDGLQNASTPGGRGSITVLRDGRQVKFEFNVH